MTDLVYTTSTTIAALWGMRHSDMLRAIHQIKDDFEKHGMDAYFQKLFCEAEYTDPTGRHLPEYQISADGVALLRNMLRQAAKLMSSDADDTGCISYGLTLDLMEAVVSQAYKKSNFGDFSGLTDLHALQSVVPFFVYQCFLEAIVANLYRSNKRTEVNVYEWFKSNYKTALGSEWRLISRKNDSKNIPDFWVHKDGIGDVPVECKKDSFTSDGLKQLKRYMHFYKTAQGIAVAKGTKVEIPENVIFIKHEV